MFRLSWKSILIGSLLLVSASLASASENNADLQAIKDADQADRVSGLLQHDWRSLVKNDLGRQARVRSLLSQGAVVTALDYYNAALVMQHGQSTSDYRLANALAFIASQLDPNNSEAKWLVAATWDRLMESWTAAGSVDTTLS